MLIGYTPTKEKDEEENMYIITEIAAAESIEGLNVKPSKAEDK